MTAACPEKPVLKFSVRAVVLILATYIDDGRSRRVSGTV
jgi:hypothetical protein